MTTVNDFLLRFLLLMVPRSGDISDLCIMMNGRVST